MDGQALDRIELIHGVHGRLDRAPEISEDAPMNQDPASRRSELRKASRRLQGHGEVRPAELLTRVANWCEEHDVTFDSYGTGPLLESFQAKVADLLGFPAGRFVPTGKLAQNVAVQVWSERAGIRHFGMHPTSHLELHESRAYSHLFQLRATLVGPRNRPLLAEHLAEVAEPLSCLLTELPIREAGGQLPTWEQLEELKREARERDVRLHLDGARLWETAAFYGRSYEEICRGFDSVYVSFYKGIGALSGAMLLGEADFLAEATVWQRRCGGEMFELTANVASAAMQFDERLARMPAYYERAVALAGVLQDLPGVRTLPRIPHTNLMHVFFERSVDDVLGARDKVAEETGWWLFDRLREADFPESSRFEWYVGEAACLVELEELRTAWARLSEVLG